MIKMSNMLLIGATDRNVGKTTFACQIIKLFSLSFPVIALKITVIKEKNGMCPRGGKGCGVCTSIIENFMITEELESDTQKDTSKMLAAGAVKVLWLRVLESHMEDGVQALIDSIEKTIGAGSAIICESNSIRKVIEPALFVVFKKKNDTYIKPSCYDVIHLSNKIVSFDPTSFKFTVDFKRFNFNGSKWSYDG